MGQVSSKMRKSTDGYSHWCPACKEVHGIRVPGWGFNNNVDSPTFTPSVKITGKQTVVKDGIWTGEWVLGPDGKALDYCCHYFITNGNIQFCTDCTHELSGKTVPLPDLPDWLTDDHFYLP